jgi:hypothetical protein
MKNSAEIRHTRNSVKEWVVEGSVGGEQWTLIDHRENNGDFNHTNVTKVFTVAVTDEGCKFIRIVQIGTNHYEHDILCLSSFEIFGLRFQGPTESQIRSYRR